LRQNVTELTTATQSIRKRDPEPGVCNPSGPDRASIPNQQEGIVKKIIVLVAVLCLIALSAWAAPKDETMTGWLSDSKCGAKGANAGHATCAKKCVEAGEKPVLVTDKDQKVIPIENPAAVSAQVGQHVQVSGAINANGALHVDKVQAQ
jgi:hypothetical protein